MPPGRALWSLGSRCHDWHRQCHTNVFVRVCWFALSLPSGPMMPLFPVRCDGALWRAQCCRVPLRLSATALLLEVTTPYTLCECLEHTLMGPAGRNSSLECQLNTSFPRCSDLILSLFCRSQVADQAPGQYYQTLRHMPLRAAGMVRDTGLLQHHFAALATSVADHGNHRRMAALRKDLVAFGRGRWVHAEASSAFVVHDTARLGVMKILITGPPVNSTARKRLAVWAHAPRFARCRRHHTHTAASCLTCTFHRSIRPSLCTCIYVQKRR